MNVERTAPRKERRKAWRSMRRQQPHAFEQHEPGKGTHAFRTIEWRKAWRFLKQH